MAFLSLLLFVASVARHKTAMDDELAAFLSEVAQVEAEAATAADDGAGAGGREPGGE